MKLLSFGYLHLQIYLIIPLMNLKRASSFKYLFLLRSLQFLCLACVSWHVCVEVGRRGLSLLPPYVGLRAQTWVTGPEWQVSLPTEPFCYPWCCVFCYRRLIAHVFARDPVVSCSCHLPSDPFRLEQCKGMQK